MNRNTEPLSTATDTDAESQRDERERTWAEVCASLVTVLKSIQTDSRKRRSAYDLAVEYSISPSEIMSFIGFFSPCRNFAYYGFRHFRGSGQSKWVEKIAVDIANAARGIRAMGGLYFPLESADCDPLIEPFADPFGNRELPPHWSEDPDYEILNPPPILWRSPYRLHAQLLQLFRRVPEPIDEDLCDRVREIEARLARARGETRRSERKRKRAAEDGDAHDDRSGFDWNRRAEPSSSDFEMLAKILEDFAKQTLWFARRLKATGRLAEVDQKAFRRKFAAFAYEKSAACGKKRSAIDNLGVAIFNLTFEPDQDVGASEYARLRRRDEAEARTKGPAKS